MAEYYQATNSGSYYKKYSNLKETNGSYNSGDQKAISKTTAGGGTNTLYGETDQGWVKMSNWKLIGSSEKTDADKKKESTEGENYDSKNETERFGLSTGDYQYVLNKYIRAFGSPPRFTDAVDPYFYPNDDTATDGGTGRSMASTWYSDPSILSLAPGTVDYLPGFSTSKKSNRLFDMFKAAVGEGSALASLGQADLDMDTNGKLYEFRSAYTDYINTVNVMARSVATFMGIGDYKYLMSNMGATKALKSFDYGFWNSQGSYPSSGNGVFDATKFTFTTAVAENTYVHFFVNGAGTSISENLSSSPKDSWLENQLGADSALGEAAETIQYLFGGAIGANAEADIQKIVKEAKDANELLGSLGAIAKNYLKGGKLVFPKIISNIRYEKTMSVNLTFTSLYGDKRSIFKYCILPCLHLLAFAAPKQLSSNMFTYPYLVRAYQRGCINMDLAFMSGLEFKRGGSDDTSWTEDGLPTEINASFNITPLYSNMMVTSAKNPFLFFNNTSLIEYLGTMVGLDLKLNNFNAKVQLINDLISGAVQDIPTNLARGFMDSKFMNNLRRFNSFP